MKTPILVIATLLMMHQGLALAADDGHGHAHDESMSMDGQMMPAAEDQHEHAGAQSGEKSGEQATHGDGHAGGHGDAGHGGGHEEEGAPIKLSPAQIKQAGIQTVTLQHQEEKQTISAPGSVFYNAYNLADVTTLVDGVVSARHVRLGDVVKKGQRLVTLTSSTLAQSQADYLRADAAFRTSKLDYERLKGLVKDKIVSQSRFQQVDSLYRTASANLAAAKATLSSYGMKKRDVRALHQSENYGKLTLRAAGAGTVAADDFRMGQHVAAGTRLLKIVDESTVWVEVKLPQSQAAALHQGQRALISGKSGHQRFIGHVINIYHQLDATTRTVGARLQVQNEHDALHPGMFVQAEIEVGHGGDEVLLLPEEAIQRQGSELIVFVEEEAGHFERREVEVGKTSMGLTPILKGVNEGEVVVVKGAFVLASELAKSGFAVHNH